ncbi:MAG: hypothetical protein OEN55_04060 [Alphaproteobacteria bacterium]|nr:hypothetical protein [Alphaproteobacteria bacterium]
MMLRPALTLTGVLFLVAAGCAAPDDDYDAAATELDDWIGESDRALVLKWGAPDAVYTMKDGGRVLTWRQSRTESQGGEPYTVTETQIVDGAKVVVPVARRTPLITWRYECVTSFEIDPDGYVVGHTAEGNDCIAQPRPD